MRWIKRFCYSPIYGKITEGIGRPSSTLSQQFGSRNAIQVQHFIESPRSTLRGPASSCCRLWSSNSEEHSVSRKWVAQRWLEEKRKKIVTRRKYARNQGSFAVEQPPVSQFDSWSVRPASLEEVKLAPLLARSNLLITRDVEWVNIMLAVEQESRYNIVDACCPESPVGFIREQSNIIFRQLLRSRRPFIAHIIDAMGNEIFRVRRPFFWINSSIYVEIDEKVVGVVHRRWHLWRRIYDLYLGNKQFAVVVNPGFWNWTFTLKDDDDNVLAQIDRNWRGFGFELFTDAGLYVIRFGNVDSDPKSGLDAAVEELEVERPLTLSERAVALALAVSLDCDYFSRRGGWGLPLLIASE